MCAQNNLVSHFPERQARDLTITEPLSIEAMRRTGITADELKPLPQVGLVVVISQPSFLSDTVPVDRTAEDVVKLGPSPHVNIRATRACL